MEYIVHKRFKGKGIGGYFNLPYGTVCARGRRLHPRPGRGAASVPQQVKMAGTLSPEHGRRTPPGIVCLSGYTATMPAASAAKTSPRKMAGRRKYVLEKPTPYNADG